MAAKEEVVGALPCHACPMGKTEFGADELVVWEATFLKAARFNILTDGYLAPVVQILGRDARPGHESELCTYVISLAPLMKTAEHKRILACMLPKLCEQFQAMAVCVMMEAWTVTGDGFSSLEATQAWKREHGSLENHPDAVEIVSVHLETKEKQEGRSYPVERDDDGKVTGLGEDTYKDTHHTVALYGQFTHLLHPVPVQRLTGRH